MRKIKTVALGILCLALILTLFPVQLSAEAPPDPTAPNPIEQGKPSGGGQVTNITTDGGHYNTTDYTHSYGTGTDVTDVLSNSDNPLGVNEADTLSFEVADNLLTSFEDNILVASFHTEGLYNLVGCGTWNGQPLSDENMPSDENRFLAATANFYVDRTAHNVLYVQVTDVTTTIGAFWWGLAFENVTQTGVAFTLPPRDGNSGVLSRFRSYSGDHANPGQILADGFVAQGYEEPITYTPGYAPELIGDAMLIHTTDRAEFGFTSLGGIYGARRLKGGGVFELTFDPAVKLRDAVDWGAMKVQAEYGRSNQYIPDILLIPDYTPPTVDAFSVMPPSVTLRNPFTISYTVSDIGSSGLNRVELWRRSETTNWDEINRIYVPAVGNGPYTGSFSDTPKTLDIYYYGIHVVDNAGNWATEGSPIRVEVTQKYKPPESLLHKPLLTDDLEW